MIIRLKFLIFAFIAFSNTAFSQAGVPKPSILEGCSFECCKFGKWQLGSLKPVTLYDKPKGQKKVGEVLPGSEVTAIKGEVHMIPNKLRVVLDHDLEIGLGDRAGKPLQLKRGDVFYLIGHSAECGERYWFNGKEGYGCITDPIIYELESCKGQPVSKKCWAQVVGEAGGETWWVQVQTKTGIIGWTSETSLFSGTDGCA